MDYVKHLIDKGYDHIFLFGGMNKAIAQGVDAILDSYPSTQRAFIKNRIHCLGNQSDIEMGPIMTRSDSVVIRGGGLSIMEQMSMPLMSDKSVLIHHEDNTEDEELTSGLSWEDSNADRLIDFLTEKGAFALKTSPSTFLSDLPKPSMKAPEGATEAPDRTARLFRPVDINKKAGPKTKSGASVSGLFSGTANGKENRASKTNPPIHTTNPLKARSGA